MLLKLNKTKTDFEEPTTLLQTPPPLHERPLIYRSRLWMLFMTVCCVVIPETRHISRESVQVALSSVVDSYLQSSNQSLFHNVVLRTLLQVLEVNVCSVTFNRRSSIGQDRARTKRCSDQSERPPVCNVCDSHVLLTHSACETILLGATIIANYTP